MHKPTNHAGVEQSLREALLRDIKPQAEHGASLVKRARIMRFIGNALGRDAHGDSAPPK